jgi:hypothetical protein
MPSKEFELLILEFAARKNCSSSSRARKVSDVLPIGLERRPIWHCQYAIIPLLFSLGILLDLQACIEGPPGIGLGIVDDQNVERIAILRFRRRNEAPIIR